MSALLPLLCLSSLPAHALPVVEVPADTESLAEAVEQVDPGGTIIIDASYVTEAGYLLITEPLTLEGVGLPALPGLLSLAPLELRGLRLVGAAPSLEIEGWNAALVLLSAELAAEELWLEPPPGVGGAYMSNSRAVAVGLRGTGGSGLPGLAAVDSELELHDSQLERQASGAILALASELRLAGVDFADNHYGDSLLEDVGGADIGLSAGSLELRESSSIGARSAGYGGSLLTDGSAVRLQETRWEDCRALVGGCLALLDTEARGSEVRLEGIELVDSHSELAGGALYAADVQLEIHELRAEGSWSPFGGMATVERGSLAMSRSVLRDHRAEAAGALGVIDPVELRIARSWFCDNRAPAGGAAVAVGARSVPVRIQNSVFARQQSRYGASVQLGPVEQDGLGPLPIAAELHNNSFLDEQGALASVSSSERPIDVRNNLFVGSRFALWAVDATISGGHNLWHANTVSVLVDEGGLPLPGVGSLFGPPELEGWSGQPCAEGNPGPGPGSPALHAGDPDILNQDGSRSHLGATGGPEALGAHTDGDADGWTDDLDCSDAEPTIHPGAEERWYNSLDEDCDGTDSDRDGDGIAWPEDCDDGDPRRFPGATEQPGDGVDQDCAQLRWVGGGCSSLPPAPAGLALSLCVLAIHQRRRRSLAAALP